MYPRTGPDRKEPSRRDIKYCACPAFKWSLIAAFALTVLRLLINVALALWAELLIAPNTLPTS